MKPDEAALLRLLAAPRPAGQFATDADCGRARLSVFHDALYVQ
jgi:hypothetical protein